jgi:hypothetical protein
MMRTLRRSRRASLKSWSGEQWVSSTRLSWRELLGVSKSFVYARADVLGARRLGSGRRARLRGLTAATSARNQSEGAAATPG